MPKLPEPTLSALRREHLVALVERLVRDTLSPETIAFVVWDVERKKVRAQIEAANAKCDAAYAQMQAAAADDPEGFLAATNAYQQAHLEWGKAEAAAAEVDAYFEAYAGLAALRVAQKKQPEDHR